MRISDRVEQIDELLQDDPVVGFKEALSLLDPPSGIACNDARAFDAYGTACRVFGDLNEADVAYRKADDHCRCERCRWDRLRRKSYLRAEQGDTKRARELAEMAIRAAPDRAMAGRCWVAAAYARAADRENLDAIATARRALAELRRSDLLYVIGALTTIGVSLSRLESPPADLLRDAREDLRALRRRWPRHHPYRRARARVRVIVGIIGYRLGELDPCELRDALARAQSTMIELGVWRDAVEITAETAEICAEMRREDLVTRTLENMLDALPRTLPRHVTVALRKLRRSLGAIDRREIRRAAEVVRAALALRPSPAL